MPERENVNTKGLYRGADNKPLITKLYCDCGRWQKGNMDKNIFGLKIYNCNCNNPNPVDLVLSTRHATVYVSGRVFALNHERLTGLGKDQLLFISSWKYSLDNYFTIKYKILQFIL